MKDPREMSKEELELYKRVLELEAEVQRSKNQPQGDIYFRVSQKGHVSVYGLQKGWPITLPAPVWEAFFGRVEDLQKFITANRVKLAA